MPKVLIANRGEIACRIIHACKAKGIATVAVYSEADAAALHVEMADEAIAIGPAKAADSYLRIEKIIEAARQSGADAVHPGYGFLAESEGFAAAVEAASLRFIGPRPAQIAAMGDKEKSRRLAVAAAVPVLPGSDRFPHGELAGLEQAGEAVGYPLLVKASGGGGGIGMKIVRDPGELRAIATATQGLAQRSFGDGTIFLERFVDPARHIEVQIFGDGAGGVIHLFERECSVQRRFQKIVEESPAPGLSDATRQRMTAAAIRLAQAVNYRSAGTVEFVLNACTEEFFFLEMNTRIQVEHPVTEAVTSLDLVGLQLDCAFDPAFTLPTAVQQRGHAIEVRLCAENPARNFLPSPGRIDRLSFGADVDGLRIDTGVRVGDTITPFYDSMIAKIIAYAPNRDAAIDKLHAGLGQMDLGALVCNHSFLRDLIDHAAFRRGQLTTNFVANHKLI